MELHCPPKVTPQGQCLQHRLGRWGQAGVEEGAPELQGYAETQGTCCSETWPGRKALDSPSLALWLIYETTGDSKLTSCHFSADPSPFPAALSHPQSCRLVAGSAFVLLVKNHPSCPNRSRFLWEAPIGIAVQNSPTISSPPPAALGTAGKAEGWQPPP